MLESLFNKTCSFIKKKLQHRCFPVNIPKFIRTPVLMNTCERLLLSFQCSLLIPPENFKNLLFKALIVPIIDSNYVSTKHNIYFNNSFLSMKVFVIKKIHEYLDIKPLSLLKNKNVLWLENLQMKNKEMAAFHKFYLVHS